MPGLHYFQSSAITYSAALLPAFPSRLSASHHCVKHLGFQLPKIRSGCASKCPDVSETPPMGWQTWSTTHRTPHPCIPFQSGSQLPRGDTLRHRKQCKTPKVEALIQVPYVCGVNLLSHLGIRLRRDL